MGVFLSMGRGAYPAWYGMGPRGPWTEVVTASLELVRRVSWAGPHGDPSYLSLPLTLPTFHFEKWLRIQSRVLGDKPTNCCPFPRASSWTYRWQLFLPTKHHSPVDTGPP